MKIIFTATTIFLAVICYAQVEIKDTRDEQLYHTVQIVSQNWLAENLHFNQKYTYFYYLNADQVFYGLQDIEENKLCPNGWDIPSVEDWGNAKNQIADLDLLRLGLIMNGKFDSVGEKGVYWAQQDGRYVLIMINPDKEMTIEEHAQGAMANCRCVKK